MALCPQRLAQPRLLSLATAVCSSSNSSSLRAFSSQPAEEGPPDGGPPDGPLQPEGFSIAAAGAPYPVHRLIGDPRTGVADDTTEPLFGEPSVELVWEQQSNGARWWRHSIAGRELPYMYLDSRLSDHSKNLLYLLRAKDPDRWTIQALADKFQIRRQRVLAILAHKEMEAAALEQGTLLRGPLRPFAYTIPLEDLALDPVTGEPLDLAQLVEAEQQQRQEGGSSVPSSSSQEPLMEGLEEFVEAAGPSTSTTTSSSRSWAASQQEADLGRLMPQVALTAQRLQAQLLQLLQRHDYDAQQLQQQLEASLAAAEAFYNQHIAGTPLEQLLLDASSVLTNSSSPASSSSDSSEQPSSSEQQEGEGEAAAAAEENSAARIPLWLDFQAQRQLQQQLIERLQPLLRLASAGAEQQAAQLSSQLQRLLKQVGTDPSSTTTSSSSSKAGDGSNSEAASDTAAAADAATGDGTPGDTPTPTATSSDADTPDSSTDSSSAGATQDGSALEALRAAAASAGSPEVLVGALRRLEVGQRRRLLELLPELRVALSSQGADLRSLTEGGATSTPFYFSGGMPGTVCPELPTWPGQVPPLVDIFGYEDIPRKHLLALIDLVDQLQQVVTQRDAVLGLLLPGGSSSTGAPRSSSSSQGGSGTGVSQLVTSGDLHQLLEVAECYVALNVAYDKAINQQAAAAAGSPDTPPLPAAAQRRMLRILREVDPGALEKVMLWEGYAREEARAGDPAKLRKMRRQIQAALNRMAQQQQAGDQGETEYPDLPDPLPPAPDRHAHPRVDWDLTAAWLDAEVVGRVYHKGSGDRHYSRLPTAPKFEGYSLEEFDAVREGELSQLSRRVAEREDEMMWAEFQERFFYNLGLAGPTLFDLRGGFARPQRPQEGWDWVVHPLTKRGQRHLQQQTGEPPQERFVMQPDGSKRPLEEEEEYLVARRTPKPRRRWFMTARRPRT